MKRKWITINEYLNPAFIKPIKVVEKEVRKKTAAHRRLIVRQLLSEGQLDPRIYPIIGGLAFKEVVEDYLRVNKLKWDKHIKDNEKL